MSDVAIWLGIGAGIIVALVAEFAVYQWFRRKAARFDEFDGGFAHENLTHITRVKAPFIITKGDNHP